MADTTCPTPQSQDAGTAPALDCKLVWKEVVDECKRILDDEEDYELIVSFHSYEQMAEHLKSLQQKQAATSAVTRMLFRVLPSFERFHSFAAYVLLGLGGQNLSAACFLGASVLLLEVGQMFPGRHHRRPLPHYITPNPAPAQQIHRAYHPTPDADAAIARPPTPRPPG